MNDDQAASKCWRNPVKGIRTSYVRKPQLDRTTGLHTRSLAHSQCCVGRTVVQDRTPPMQPAQLCALLKLTKSINEQSKCCAVVLSF